MGIEAAQSILHRANDALDKEDRLAAVVELQGRVEDWKGHRVEHFGELLLYGNFTVLKGEGAREVEREVSATFYLLTVKKEGSFPDKGFLNKPMTTMRGMPGLPQKRLFSFRKHGKRNQPYAERPANFLYLDLYTSVYFLPCILQDSFSSIYTFFFTHARIH
jgi:hypothetical protein